MATAVAEASVTRATSFPGFYRSLLPEQAELDHLIWQFSHQLLKALKLYNNRECKVVIDTKEVELTESLMVLHHTPPPNPFVRDMQMEFYLFRGDYIKVFQDGLAIYNILCAIIDSYKTSRVELKSQYEKYKQENKSNPYLRASYWYIGKLFVNKLPSKFQIAFSVDCLLYGEWRCSHPNLVGLHLLVLAWMLGVAELQKFVPPRLRRHRTILAPIFGAFLPQQLGIKMKLDTAAAAAAAAAAAGATGRGAAAEVTAAGAVAGEKERTVAGATNHDATADAKTLDAKAGAKTDAKAGTKTEAKESAKTDGSKSAKTDAKESAKTDVKAGATTPDAKASAETPDSKAGAKKVAKDATKKS